MSVNDREVIWISKKAMEKVKANKITKRELLADVVDRFLGITKED